ncbi:enamine deaminase RidA [Pacificimonas flava]|uniref:Enamine deaminase RidA n=2 Tax=Pacificimonas TaxID=1960290 RepID=A0A219B5H0_9SPHN|nr:MULTISPECIES: RidA family protein [Pacificimonas]MBZ6379179.1 RidA family protein [Pacificimonas aurantium]OWV33597.1 enamine deaminase RidA [Pacificimonas flava]
MTSKRINPASLYESVGYGFSHATVDTKGGTVHLSGQVAWDKDYAVVGGDNLGLQARQALKNLREVLEASGSGIEQLLRLRTYIVDHNPEKLGIVSKELADFYGDVVPAANTVVGVQALALPDFLVEIEATAVLKD